MDNADSIIHLSNNPGQSDNKLSNSKLSGNNLASGLGKKEFFNAVSIEEVVMFMIHVGSLT